MKLTKLALAASLAIGLTSAHAATINFGNFDFAFGSGNELLVVDNSGAPITEGFIALYQFAEAPTDASAIGADGLLSSVAIGPANAPGGIGFINTPLTVANDGALTGVPLFVVIGNGADAASSDQFGVLATGLSFSKADNPPPPDSQFYTASAADVRLGEVSTADVDGSGLGGGAFNAQVLKLTPEPSSTMLFGLAGLALLIRRKR